MNPVETTTDPGPHGADDLPPAAPGDAPSTSALVVEVSQLRYALRARTVRSAAAADGEFRAVLRRRDALLRELRRRGLDFPEERSEPSTAGHEQSAPARDPVWDPAPESDAAPTSDPASRPDPATEPDVARAAVVPVDLAAKVAQLEQGLTRRTVIGQAQGILIERFKVTADEAFALLARSSSITNRKLYDIAVDLVLTGELPGRA